MIVPIYLAAFVITINALSLDAEEQQFVTNLVGDIKSHRGDYIAYYITGSIPPNILSLANEAKTYSGSDFGSLLQENSVDISSLEAFASHLPWATRLDIVSDSSGSSSTDSASTNTASTGQQSTSSRSNGSVKITSGLVVIAGIAATLL